MKVLYFDVEHGSKTLGSEETIAKNFGLPMLTPSSWDEFQSTIGKIYKTETVKKKVKMSDTFEIEQTVSKIVPRNDIQIDALVIDTFSELSKKFMRTLTDKTGKMKLQEWGRLKNKLDTALEFVTRIPGNVILTCHSKVQTMDSGENRLQPYVDGSTKEDISKWFDFVFYTKTITKDDGTREYKWITANSEMYNHAKDRTQLLPEEMDQDFNQVLTAASKKGFNGSKILVIGSPGSGKTFSLKSLINPLLNEDGSEEDPHNLRNNHMPEPERTSMEQAADAEDPNFAESTPANGEIAYLRGETNNIEEVSNENINS